VLGSLLMLSFGCLEGASVLAAGTILTSSTMGFNLCFFSLDEEESDSTISDGGSAVTFGSNKEYDVINRVFGGSRACAIFNLAKSSITSTLPDLAGVLVKRSPYYLHARRQQRL
jgi:hypothetical protein